MNSVSVLDVYSLIPQSRANRVKLMSTAKTVVTSYNDRMLLSTQRFYWSVYVMQSLHVVSSHTIFQS